MTRTTTLLVVVLGTIMMSMCSAVILQDQPFGDDLWVRDYKIPTSDDPSLSLFVRNKYRRVAPTAGVGRANRTLIFIAGATYPTSTAFDLSLGGTSWMDYIARNDYDVWLLDQRGYGRSDRPIEMSQPAAANGPICNTSVMAYDVATVVQFIFADRGISQLNVMGWSWGTSIMSLFTSRNPSMVQKIILYSPQWVRAPNTAPTTAYRTVDRATAMVRWMNNVRIPIDDLIPFNGFDIWWNATVVLDPVGNAAVPPVVRAPNGIQLDNSVYWGNNNPVYDILQLTMPVLIVHGEWDMDLPLSMTQAVWANLTQSVNKRWIEIAKGTHTMLLEFTRMSLYRAVQQFLDEPNPISTVPQPSVIDFLSLTQSSCASTSDYESSYRSALAAAIVMACILFATLIALVVTCYRRAELAKSTEDRYRAGN